MPPLNLVAGGLSFEPMAGGARTRDNRLAAGAYNHQVAEATRFGMVNAFYHVGVAADRINTLLGDLGASALPRLRVVVAAHSGSRLPGFAQGDGDLRQGRMLSFFGGHYRVSNRTSGVPEPLPVTPLGEVHLGPGRVRQRFAGVASYLRNAAHNPATIYHEYGHHLCRHTADFRLNSERAPMAQRNGKIGIEEGICDYFAAALLGTGRPYGWYLAGRGERRDPAVKRRLASGEFGDAHAVGSVWAAALWWTRQRLVHDGILAAPHAHDRAVVATLLELSRVATRPADPRPRSVREAERCTPETVLAAYLRALQASGGGRAVRVAREIFTTAGLPGRKGSAC